jgi:predicted RNA-binding Zn-ribbon protein involved in translation (DUF1610 family)
VTKYSPESEYDDEEEDYSGAGEYSPESQDAGTFKCPKCSAEIYGDSPRCPSCGDYVTPGNRSTAAALPRWVWIVAVLVILALIAGALRSFR